MRPCLLAVLVSLATGVLVVLAQNETSGLLASSATTPSLSTASASPSPSNTSTVASTNATSLNSTAAASAVQTNTTAPLFLLSPLSAVLLSTPYTNHSAVKDGPKLPPSYTSSLAALSSLPMVLNTTYASAHPMPMKLQTSALSAKVPVLYPLSVLLLLLSHVLSFAARVPHLVLATFPPGSQAYQRMLGWLRPYALPAPSPAEGTDGPPLESSAPPTTDPSNREAKLYTLRRLVSHLHLVVLLVFLVCTVLWRNKLSSTTTVFNASTASLLLLPLSSTAGPDPAGPTGTTTHSLSASSGELLALYSALGMAGVLLWYVEKRSVERWAVQQAAVQTAYTGVRAEVEEWKRRCERLLWEGERALRGKDEARKADPPAYPAAAVWRAPHDEKDTLRVDVDARAGPYKADGEEEVAEAMSWRLVGDRSGRIYN